MASLKVAWFNGAKYSVRIIGIYPMVSPVDKVWKSLNIKHYIDNGLVLAHDFDVITPPTPTEDEVIESNAMEAQMKMVKELDWTDSEVKKHEDGHSRIVSSMQLLRKYRNECRDYVQNVDGSLIIVGSKPIRPV